MQLQNANKAVCLIKMLFFSEESEIQNKPTQTSFLIKLFRMHSIFQMLHLSINSESRIQSAPHGNVIGCV